jgi:2-keto-4-pentenoate hydratase
MTERFDTEVLDSALRAQVALKDVWEASGEPVGAWKVGFTTSDPRTPGDNRQVFPAEYRPFGFILASRVLESPAEIRRSLALTCQVEPEIYVSIGKPLSGEVTIEQARDAVERVGAAFEVNENRYVNRVTPLPVRIAAGLSNWGMVVGSGIEPPDWDIRSTTVSVSCNDSDPLVIKMPDGSFDDPFLSLTRLCKRLDRFGLGLREGDFVLTGAFSHHKVEANQSWAATFGGVGRVEAHFTE